MNLSNLKVTSKHINIVLIIIVALLLLRNIWRKEPEVVDPNTDKITKLELHIAAQDSIVQERLLEIAYLQTSIDSLHVKNDSITKSKIKVTHIYHEIYKDITTATNTQLDSLIRTNW